MINRENLGKSLVAASHLKKGHIIEAKDIKVLSPGQGLSPQKYNKLLGRVLDHNMDEEDFEKVFFSERFPLLFPNTTQLHYQKNIQLHLNHEK